MAEPRIGQVDGPLNGVVVVELSSFVATTLVG